MKRTSTRLPRLVAVNVLAGGAYWSVALLVRWYFSRFQMWPAPIWFPAGVAMFAVLLFGSWSAPGIFLGSLLTNTISFGETLLWGAVVSWGNTLGPVVAMQVLRNRFRRENPFSRVSDVFIFGIGVMAQGMISGAIGASVVGMKMGASLSAWPARWSQWSMSDAGASLLLVPFLLLLERNALSLGRVRKHPFEFLITTIAAVGTVLCLLSGSTGSSAAEAGASFLILLPLLWLAVRFSTGVAYPLFVAVSAVVILATLAGYGPYAGEDRGGTFIIFAQMAVGFGVAVLLLGAASEEQRAAETELRHLNQDLENRVEQRTAELRKSQEQMEKAALHDPLTGLPNRRFLEQRFSACRAAALRRGNQMAFLLIDLDHFKQINDTLGHGAGDEFLIETGRKLAAVVREYDVVARLGGDEFAVLLPETVDRTSIESICSRIVQALTRSVFVDGKRLGTSPSIGVALFPDHGSAWHLIYKAADVALYEAKRAGRGRWEWTQGAAAMPEASAMTAGH